MSGKTLRENKPTSALQSKMRKTKFDLGASLKRTKPNYTPHTGEGGVMMWVWWVRCGCGEEREIVLLFLKVHSAYIRHVFFLWVGKVCVFLCMQLTVHYSICQAFITQHDSNTV